MRIVFYLPVVTPWWFENVIVPLLEKLAPSHEVHVVAPQAWKGTGIGPAQADLCAHLPLIRWHIITDETHPSMRTEPVQRDAIISFMNTLAPDYVLCRSADLETTKAFPGTVRHITEGRVAPFDYLPGRIVFTNAPFDHGILPELGSELEARLDRLIEPLWESLASRYAAAGNSDGSAKADLDNVCKILLLPLEYEHEENFFTIHSVAPRPNARLVEDLIERLDERFFLAVTNHPLNELHVDNGALEDVIAAHPSRARLFRSAPAADPDATTALMREADGVFLGDSKTFGLAGYFGTPVCRRSRFKTGDWLNAYDDIDSFASAIADGTVISPDTCKARTWFAFHLANSLISTDDPALTGDDLLERIEKPVDPSRWDRNFAHFAQDWPEVAQ
jgi:hypothetical protein